MTFCGQSTSFFWYGAQRLLLFGFFCVEAIRWAAGRNPQTDWDSGPERGIAGVLSFLFLLSFFLGKVEGNQRFNKCPASKISPFRWPLALQPND